MNPCPCGYYGDLKRDCRCSHRQIQNYRNKISGPLLDRIDIHVEVPTIEYQELSSLGAGEPSVQIRERVKQGRAVQRERFKKVGRIHSNAEMGAKETQKYCTLKGEAQDLLKMAISELNFSARAYNRILKVSRTIADMADCEEIQANHVSEAIQYRSLDRSIWT